MTDSLLSRLVRLANWLSAMLAMMSGLAVFLMMVITVTDVVLINTRIGTVGIAVESIEMLMIAVVFGALAYADVLNKHVSATMLIDHLPPRPRALCDVFGYSLSLAICLVFTWELFGYAEQMTSIRKSCLSSDLPYYPFTWFAVGGFVLFDLRYLARVLTSVEAWRKGG
jgi:TRAP-type C4-dicarboxylate transport system permease small subunit